jgi:hypothetical protein
VHESRDARSPAYFRTALEASLEAGFKVEAASVEQLGAISPNRYPVVVLSNVASLPQAFEDALRAHVRAGGGVLIAAGPTTAVKPKVPVFDEAIGDTRYAGREKERFRAVAEVDAAHPALRRANKFENVKFYQTVRITPGQARVLARLDDQTPLVLEKQLGEGRVLLFASTFDNISNDLPLHAAFVPFAEQAANYLAGDDSRPPAYPVGAYLDLRSAKEKGVAVEVVDPGGRRPLTLAEATSATTLQLAQQGYYDVRRANGRHELAAVTADRRESDLDILPAETVALWQNTGQGAVPAGSAEAEARRFSLWWYVMLGVFLMAIAETIAGSRYLKPRQEES